MKDRYGSWSRQDLIMTIMGLFSPNITTETEMLAEIEEIFDTPEKRADFAEAFREFLLDNNVSFKEKADRVLEMDLTEEDAIDIFRDRWKALTPDEPCPIGEKGPWPPKK